MQDLSSFHTFHIAVRAHKIIEVFSLEQLQQAWQTATAEGLPVLLVGQGSNLLFLEDFNGVVIINRLLGIRHREDPFFHYLQVNGGENWHKLVEWSLEHGIYGLENLALIPGCAGSAPIQNIGAYGVEFKDVCEYVDVLNLATQERFRLTMQECQFGYRDSIFKHGYRQNYAVIAISLKLAKNWQPVLKYGSLTAFNAAETTAKMIFDEVCRVRRHKLPDPAEFGNAGSFFKNPIISAQHFTTLCKLTENLPHFPQPDGTIKLAAGWLIEQCGLKGYQIGGAAVHLQQALVLINRNHADGKDVAALAKYVRQTVANRFGVYLQPEVRFIGTNGEIDSEQAIS